MAPSPSLSEALGTSAARLKSLTAEPVLGGTKEAAMVSTFLADVGGQLSLMTTTSGPGVSGMTVVSSVAPLAWSLIVMVPLPP